MSTAMKKKATFGILSATLLLAIAAWAYKPGGAGEDGMLNTSGQAPNVVTIKVRQLPIDIATNAPPAEILNPTALSKAKNEVEQFSCVVKNNTNKNITAVTLALTIILEEWGKEKPDTYLFTTDTLVHPDIKEERGLKDTEPGSSRLMQLPGPMSFTEGAIIKRITVEIRCIVFDDGSSLGYDLQGIAVTRIRLTREGAAKYKAWLEKQWREQRYSRDELIQKITSHTLPEGELPANSLKEGADIYRRWLLRVYNSKGADAVITHLSK